ncbi:MAG: hypothetical protein ACYSUI_25640 [Planctomycetota bacterium]|jgi:hypothetical protein
MKNVEPQCEQCGKPASVFVEECDATQGSSVTQSQSHAYCADCAPQKRFDGNVDALKERLTSALHPVPIRKLILRTPPARFREDTPPLCVTVVIDDKHVKSGDSADRILAVLGKNGLDGGCESATAYERECKELSRRLGSFDGIDQSAVEKLIDMGITNFCEFAEMEVQELAGTAGLAPDVAARIIARAK